MLKIKGEQYENFNVKVSKYEKSNVKDSKVEVFNNAIFILFYFF
jgi:hypothetical protein